MGNFCHTLAFFPAHTVRQFKISPAVERRGASRGEPDESIAVPKGRGSRTPELVPCKPALSREADESIAAPKGRESRTPKHFPCK